MENASGLKGKVYLLTGASRGIGASIAQSLGVVGAEVILVARDEANLQQVAESVNAAGGTGHIKQVDLREESALIELAGQIGEKWGRLDGLINNAGIAESGSVAETTTETWDRLMAVNARSAFILCRECLDLLRQTERPKIINVASVVGVKGYPNQTAYSASKHALRGFSIALANELKDEKINVHVICPGGVATEMVSTMRPDLDLRELIQPEEVAEIVMYLLTHRGNAVIDEFRLRRQTNDPWF
jgi:3-oxoacyl-[acyl-carrier protein] reductase